MSRWVSLGLSAFLGSVLCSPPARAQLTSESTACRRSIGKGVRQLAETVVKERSKCHLLRMRGSLLPETDCNGAMNAPSSRILAAEAKLLSLTQRTCARLSPALNNYFFCPAPCSELAITDYESVAVCLTCFTKSHADDLVVTGFGTPPAPAAVVPLACQGHVGHALRVYLTAIVKEQQRCQLAEDRSPTGVDCKNFDPRERLTRARARLETTLARCDPDAFAYLDSCAGDPIAEAACLKAAVKLLADTLFDAVYRPGTLPTPTALWTPTSTGTPTLTATPTVTAVPTYTSTSTSTSTSTYTPTRTPTSTPGISATPSPTPTATFTRTPIPTATATSSFTATMTSTPTRTPSATPSATPVPQPCNPDSESYNEPSFYRNLAYRWAPFIIHDTASKWNADMIGRMDFDGDWRSNNNWNNLPDNGIAPFIYYNVLETSTHWFIHYHTFHPRDWNNAFFGTCGPDPDCHENDTENLLIMVQKDSSMYGRFRLLQTMAHGTFYQYALANDGVSAGTGPDADDLDNDPERGFTLFVDSSVGINDPRPAVYVESKGHGICDWWDNNGPFCQHPDDMVGTSGNDGIMYYPSATATPSVPPNPSGGQWFNFKSPYNLISIWNDVWVLRSCIGNSLVFDPGFTYAGVPGNGSSWIGKAMDGDDYADDAATAWWAQSDDDNNLAPGDWTIDPARTVLRQLTFSETVATTYTYNPFLGIQ